MPAKASNPRPAFVKQMPSSVATSWHGHDSDPCPVFLKRRLVFGPQVRIMQKAEALLCHGQPPNPFAGRGKNGIGDRRKNRQGQARRVRSGGLLVFRKCTSMLGACCIRSHGCW